MREIKFRAWVEGANVMETWKSMSNADLTGFLKGEYSNVKAMQYTGLKDKNGVEIYEGDIVQVKDHAFQRKEGSLSGIHIDGNYVVGYTDRMELVCGSWLLWNQRPYITVIGNRYENPELLEEEPTC